MTTVSSEKRMKSLIHQMEVSAEQLKEYQSKVKRNLITESELEQQLDLLDKRISTIQAEMAKCLEQEHNENTTERKIETNSSQKEEDQI